jgi:hypothetical protein
MGDEKCPRCGAEREFRTRRLAEWKCGSFISLDERQEFYESYTCVTHQRDTLIKLLAETNCYGCEVDSGVCASNPSVEVGNKVCIYMRIINHQVRLGKKR